MIVSKFVHWPQKTKARRALGRAPGVRERAGVEQVEQQLQRGEAGLGPAGLAKRLTRTKHILRGEVTNVLTMQSQM